MKVSTSTVVELDWGYADTTKVALPDDITDYMAVDIHLNDDRKTEVLYVVRDGKLYRWERIKDKFIPVGEKYKELLK